MYFALWSQSRWNIIFKIIRPTIVAGFKETFFYLFKEHIYNRIVNMLVIFKTIGSRVFLLLFRAVYLTLQAYSIHLSVCSPFIISYPSVDDFIMILIKLFKSVYIMRIKSRKCPKKFSPWIPSLSFTASFLSNECAL